jgi:hypothetical protein
MDIFLIWVSSSFIIPWWRSCKNSKFNPRLQHSKVLVVPSLKDSFKCYFSYHFRSNVLLHQINNHPHYIENEWFISNQFFQLNIYIHFLIKNLNQLYIGWICIFLHI